MSVWWVNLDNKKDFLKNVLLVHGRWDVKDMDVMSLDILRYFIENKQKMEQIFNLQLIYFRFIF